MKTFIIGLVLIMVFFIFGFMAGFLARDSKVKQETINAQEKKIDNTVGLKKEVSRVDKEIKHYEIKCNDILNFDITKCL